MSNLYHGSYHDELFEWQCRSFFAFDEYLTTSEITYLRTCFRLPKDYVEISPLGYEHFSYYSYSHRVCDGQTNSSRIAYGSIAHPLRTWEAAQPVLTARGIDISPDWIRPDWDFYGLGWDIIAGEFKVYFRVDDVRRTGLDDLVQCLEEALQLRPEGLVSYSYESQACIERKVYGYPKHESPIPGTHSIAFMATDKRGLIEQHNVSDPSVWCRQLNAAGRAIVDKYTDANEPLDTIAFHGADDFTVYFP